MRRRCDAAVGAQRPPGGGVRRSRGGPVPGLAEADDRRGVGDAPPRGDCHQRAQAAMALLPVAAGTLLPALRWTRLRRRAAEERAVIMRRLPRLLTGARVLLESGAVTPQQALSTAASVYSDPAADILREVLVDQEVRRVELQEALDKTGQAYGLEPLRRLADAYRVGARHGTQMAALLSEFALDLRQAEHSAYRARMTR